MAKPIKIKQQHLNKITIANHDGEEIVVDLAHIFYFEADGNYTKIVYSWENKPTTTLVSKPIAQYELQLLQHGFLRIHHSYLINTDAIKIINHRQHFVKMLNGDLIAFSKPHYQQMHQLFIGDKAV